MVHNVVHFECIVTKALMLRKPYQMNKQKNLSLFYSQNKCENLKSYNSILSLDIY
jgi:hypothetical protein